MAKRGRKDVYASKILPRFDEIKKWIEEGATEREVAEHLGIAYSTFNKYKVEKKELMELLKTGRKEPVEKIKSAMLKRALGFQYEEKKVTHQRMLVDGEYTNDYVVKTEVVTKTALPDVAAGLVLLKHWAKDEEWSSDPQSLELKKKELELKEKKLEDESW